MAGTTGGCLGQQGVALGQQEVTLGQQGVTLGQQVVALGFLGCPGQEGGAWDNRGCTGQQEVPTPPVCVWMCTLPGIFYTGRLLIVVLFLAALPLLNYCFCFSDVPTMHFLKYCRLTA